MKTIVILSALVWFSGPYDLLSQDVFLFSYFKGNGEDGLHLAYSDNGRTWTALRNDSSFLRGTVGDSLMRDPCIYRTDDGIFHMVWTSGWWNNGFGYASSRDLTHWSSQKYVRPMLNEPATKNNWAPEIFFDDSSKQYIVFWSAWIPGRYPKTDSAGSVFELDPAKPKKSHRIYASFTKDFSSFTPAVLFYEPGFNVIDATMVKRDGRYIMFCKDETLTPPQKNIRMATSDGASGPYGKASPPITGDYWAEGPTTFFIGETCFVYFDKYRDHAYGAVISTDLVNWTDISNQVQCPAGMRHGTILGVPRDVLEKVMRED